MIHSLASRKHKNETNLVLGKMQEIYCHAVYTCAIYGKRVFICPMLMTGCVCIRRSRKQHCNLPPLAHNVCYAVINSVRLVTIQVQ